MGTFRTRSTLFVPLVSLSLAAGCGDPGLQSELSPEGPPEVLQVNVLSESSIFAGDLRLGETATFCRAGAEYKVNAVYCPEARDATNKPIDGDREVAPALDAMPYALSQGYNDLYWHARVVFDELLDPDIETAQTEEDGSTTWHLDQGLVTVTCGGTEVAYDGFYDPSGNHLSYPPGPALVVSALDFVATGTMCELAVSAVADEDGEVVPSDQRGPYEFGIAPLAVYETDPADAAEGVDPTIAPTVLFNAPIDLATAAGKVTLTQGATDVPVTLAYFTDADGFMYDWIVAATPAAPLAPNTTYTLTVTDGVADIGGGALAFGEPITATFTTAP